MKLLRTALVFHMLGLLVGLVAVLRFHRLTMTAYFAIGIPLVFIGMVLFLVSMWRFLTRKGVL